MTVVMVIVSTLTTTKIMATALPVDSEPIYTTLFEIESIFHASNLRRTSGTKVITFAKACRILRVKKHELIRLLQVKHGLSKTNSFIPHLEPLGYTADELSATESKDAAAGRVDLDQLCCFLILMQRFFHYEHTEAIAKDIIQCVTQTLPKTFELAKLGLEPIPTRLRPPNSRTLPTSGSKFSNRVGDDGLLPSAIVIESDIEDEEEPDDLTGFRISYAGVYFIRSNESNFFKIGKSKQLPVRFKSVYYSQPLGATLVKYITVFDFLESNGPIPGIGFNPTPELIEDYLHVLFHKQRRNGEWFELTEDQICSTFPTTDYGREISQLLESEWVNIIH